MLRFPFLSLRVLYFLCYAEVSLDSKLESLFSKRKKRNSKFLKIFRSILCRMDKNNFIILKHKCTFILCSYHFNTPFFSIPSQKKGFYVKRKNNTQSSCMIFSFRILCQMEIYFNGLIIYQSGVTVNTSNI